MKKLWVLIIILVLANLTFSCASPEALGPSATGKVSLQMYVTDNFPKEVNAVEVKAKNIEFHKTDATTDTWIAVIKNPPMFDLVKIAGVNILLGTLEIASGNYSQIRLDIAEVNVTVGGKQLKATLPSDKLKLFIIGTFSVEDGKRTPITINFDSEKSVVLAGKDEVMLIPIVKLIAGKPEFIPAASTANTTYTH